MHDAVRCRVVVVPSGPVSAVWTAALRDVADAAQLSAVAGGEGRHHTVVSCHRLVRVDGTQAPKATSRQRRAPSRTCRGVSASSLHSRHSAAGHSMELHCVQPGEGRRPTLCRYCSEPLQWPARSSDLSPRPGPDAGPARWNGTSRPASSAARRRRRSARRPAG